ncbi:lysozyme inhibitor LprI family protein [Pectobacterium atrosepticum]|uniref:lysozyme inhibitor LprI family protein n=1 Tax=Pectobacterium atrosepticum TaxID=29471 RepID=UPI000500A045|nr:lysozyme inhibitor LprI family protein [Pectobacterium atrosepticum]KFX24148.1 hypothetical protein KP24_13640 [Pectobacterium atrosepticum]
MKKVDGLCLKEMKPVEKLSKNKNLSSSNGDSLSQLEKEEAIVNSYAIADERLNEVWKSLTKTQKDELLKEQRNWIKEKERCATTECKVEMTINRIAIIEKHLI